jgi:hypothetical protein
MAPASLADLLPALYRRQSRHGPAAEHVRHAPTAEIAAAPPSLQR